MKKITMFLIAFMLLGITVKAQVNGFYSINTDTDNLVFIDYSGNLNIIGSLGVDAGAYGGLAFYNGNLYLQANDRLYNINLNTGAATELFQIVDNVTSNPHNGPIAFHSNGTLYLYHEEPWENPGRLYTVNTTTGVATAISSNYNTYVSTLCIAFDQNDVLYGMDEAAERLLIFNINTGEVSYEFPNSSGISYMWSLGFDNSGQLWAIDMPNLPNVPSKFYNVDKTLGTTTFVFDLPEIYLGLAKGTYSNLNISTNNQTANVGRTIEIPVLTSELVSDDNVIAYQFDFNYDNTKLEYVGNTLAGTLAEGGTLQVNPTTNKLSIAWARGTALVGEGEILKLQFKVLAVGETTPTITNALYNTESVNATNGKITAVYKYGDIDANDFVQAYDAALAIQYSVGLDPLPTIDPLPWENWRVIVADIDGTAGVTANDASEILKYTVGLISTFPVESGKKSGKTETADVNITLVNSELIFQPTGELFGLNVNVTENISVLGQPQFLNANMLNATNINANIYSIGLATANAPSENETFMKIPVVLTQGTNLTFDLIINTTVKSVTVSGTTGIVTINDKAISVYPNPTNSILYVNGMENANISIFDLTGKMLINKHNTDNQINVSNLQNGIYSVKITNENGTVIRKFVKQ